MQDLAHPTIVLVALFIFSQGLYALTFLVDLYVFTLPVNRVRMADGRDVPERDYPPIVLFYPVLRELEATMRTTLLSLKRIKYPAGRARIVAIPNSDDLQTIAGLRRLQAEFPFLEVLEIPPTTDATWNLIWDAWQRNPKAYWWHVGRHAGDRGLPPKKTRQLIYAFYHVAAQQPDKQFLVNYIDADSCPPPDHFLAAVAGMQRFDVLQSQNVAGNLNASLAASWHSLDHMAWDGMKYAHLSGDGRQPYWLLGKGLFIRSSDLVELGGLHPWLTIEDPEIGMRLWANGRRLGIIEQPLIEEVPLTFAHGITQRKRWVCGFFQSLGEPLDRLGFTPWQKVKAWMNFIPCLSLSNNVIGIPIGLWALSTLILHTHDLPRWTLWLASANLAALAVTLVGLYANIWRRTGLVLDSTWQRLAYVVRVNPLFVAIWWTFWLIPLAIGLWMYLRDRGQVWERTEKINANQVLIETHFGGAAHQRAA